MDLVASYGSSPSGSAVSEGSAHVEDGGELTSHESKEPSPKRLKVEAARLPDPSALLQPDQAATAPAPAPPTQRIRVFPHVEGQFAVHVTLSAPAPPDVTRALRAALPRLRAALPTLCGLDLGTGHVSLSHTAPAVGSQLESLLRMLTAAAWRLAPFALDLRRLACLANEDASLAFLAIEGQGAGGAFARAVRAVDAVFRRHGLPTFYVEPRPHVSVAWVPGDALERLEAVLKQQSVLLPAWHIEATELVCKIGQRTHALKLGGDR